MSADSTPGLPPPSPPTLRIPQPPSLPPLLTPRNPRIHSTGEDQHRSVHPAERRSESDGKPTPGVGSAAPRTSPQPSTVERAYESPAHDGDTSQSPSREAPKPQSGPNRGNSTPREGLTKDRPRALTPPLLPPPPVELHRNQFVEAPPLVDAFDGRVASLAGFRSLVVTTPNQTYVPEYPIERQTIKTFSDGLWGVHEYSRWPQELVTGMWHVACIPQRGTPGFPPILWHNLHPEEDWHEDQRSGMLSLGFLNGPVVSELNAAVEQAVAAFKRLPDLSPTRRALGDQLCMLVLQCAARMTRLPAKPGIAVAVGAHVQRLCLELAGLKTYLQVVSKRMETPRDYSKDVLPVLGTFVREGTAAQTCCRIGLPVWFLQPLTPHIKIWRVVQPVTPHAQSMQESVPAVHHAPKLRAGVMNLTGNWLATMVQGVSLQLCSTVSLALPTVPSGEEPDEAHTSKKARPADMPVVSKTLAMAPVAPQQRKPGRKQWNSGGKSTPTVPAAGPAPTSGVDAPPAPSGSQSAALRKPSLDFCPSPFSRPPDAWMRSLGAVGRLPQPSQMLRYFYPPPFLLDTIPSNATLPVQPAPEAVVRNDEKLPRYLHNLVRVRGFCRVRLLEPTVSGEPLSIADWRVALFGEYVIKETPEVKGASEARRCKRRYEAKNAITRLFVGAGALRTYSAEDTPSLLWLAVTRKAAAEDLRVRYYLLWEAHEVNWRCELLALDQLLVPRDDWPTMYRWEREAEVSAVWGETSGVIGVLPDLARDVARPFCWLDAPEPDWQSRVRPVVAFMHMMTRWPDFPLALREVPKKVEDWKWEDYEGAQRTAVQFYVETFIKHFSRLPTYPFRFPAEREL